MTTAALRGEYDGWLDELRDWRAAEARATLDSADPSDLCEATLILLEAKGGPPAGIGREVLSHTAGEGACWRCRVRLLARSGAAEALALQDDLEPVDFRDSEEPPVTDPEPWSSELGDLPWRCGWPGPLGRVAASSGISKAELAEDMGAARAGSERDAILEYLARRFAEGELKTWWDRWTPGGHEAEDLGPTEKVEAAAGEARQVLLKPTRVLGDPTGSSDVTVEVREIHEDDSGWRTRYSCLVGRDRYSFRSARWRLLFEPQDLDRCLRRRRSTDATLPHQRHLGLARILFGEIAWQDLLDCLVPHRTGSFDADAQLLTRTVDGRLPGDVIGYELRVALDSDA